MAKKKCRSCGKVKPISDFYCHPQMADGHLNICKECVKLKVRSRENKLKQDPKWVDSERARARDKYYRLYRSKKASYLSRRKSSLLYKIKYPEKQKAKEAAFKYPCKVGYHRHHWSYQREHYLDFIEIPQKLHYKIHRYMKYLSTLKMYQTIDGVILDTREKHEQFIKAIELLP